MTAPTPEECAELELVLHPPCESCESNPACKDSGQCWLCAVLKHNAVLALIRERDKARFEAQFLCQALRFLKKEEKVNP